MKKLTSKTTFRLALAAFLTILVTLKPVENVRADEIVLQPHRAVYSAKLHNIRNGGNVAAVDGTMIISFEKACDGWIFAQQLALDVGLSNGRSLRQEIRFAGWEALDGNSYRFASRETTGRRQTGIKGAAHLPGGGKSGHAEFKVPESKIFDLPTGTIFPITHTMKLIAAAQDGQRLDQRFVFDGSSFDGPQQMTAFIGKEQPPEPRTQSVLGPLATRRGWPVRMAVFPIGSQAAEPSFEIEILQLDNGVARRMVLELGEFSLLLELQALEAIATPSC